MDNREEIFERLNSLLSEKKYSAFMREIDELNDIDAAEYLESLPDDLMLSAFRMLKKDAAAGIFSFMDLEMQEAIIGRMSDTEIAMIIEDLFVDDAVDILEELPAIMVKRILKLSRPETRDLINKFLSYPEESAGSVMTAEFIDLHQEMTVSQAIDNIRRKGIEKETVYVAYVTNESRVLEGIVSLKDLIFAKPDALIGDIMDTDIVCANTLDHQEEVVAMIQKYDMLALPIVDKENRLVGIVTVDDALDVIEEEATEDIEKMAAIVPSDKPYMRADVFEIWKTRIPWLLLLMLSATFTGQIIAGFEGKLAAIPALIAFIPMLMGTGGNSGGQSSVTIIRGLAVGEIENSDIFKIIWKETRVALLCGVVLAACNFVKIILVDNLIFGNGVTIAANIVVSLTLILTVLVAKIVGCALPVAAKRLGLDPAVMASPFITTIVDAVSLLIYFAIASAILL
ncbi:MAG: magnesium transporter [Clostridia bacterium]|nr:magnesium transporter [Clostridia bacterium]